MPHQPTATNRSQTRAHLNRATVVHAVCVFLGLYTFVCVSPVFGKGVSVRDGHMIMFCNCVPTYGVYEFLRLPIASAELILELIHLLSSCFYHTFLFLEFLQSRTRVRDTISSTCQVSMKRPDDRAKCFAFIWN